MKEVNKLIVSELIWKLSSTQIMNSMYCDGEKLAEILEKNLAFVKQHISEKKYPKMLMLMGQKTGGIQKGDVRNYRIEYSYKYEEYDGKDWITKNGHIR